MPRMRPYTHNDTVRIRVPSPTNTRDTEVPRCLRALASDKEIKEFKETPGQFVSRLFLVLKKDGSQRLVLYLKPLNKFVRKQKFKMEGTKVIRDILQEGDWMASIDLKDAYLSVVIAQKHRRYLSGSGWRRVSSGFSACRLASAMPHGYSQNC